MWGLIAARLSPTVLVGLGATVLVLCVLGFTYHKGYKASDQKWRVRWAEMEQERAEYAAKMSAKVNMALARKHTRQADLAGRMNDIPIPDSGSCVDTGWLLSFNNSVRISNNP